MGLEIRGWETGRFRVETGRFRDQGVETGRFRDQGVETGRFRGGDGWV